MFVIFVSLLTTLFSYLCTHSASYSTASSPASSARWPLFFFSIRRSTLARRLFQALSRFLASRNSSARSLVFERFTPVPSTLPHLSKGLLLPSSGGVPVSSVCHWQPLRSGACGEDTVRSGRHSVTWVADMHSIHRKQISAMTLTAFKIRCLWREYSAQEYVTLSRGLQ